MLRALSTRRSRRGYEQFTGDEASTEALVPKLSRAKSLPAKILISRSNKFTTTPAGASYSTSEAQQVKKPSKLHPFFRLFETRKKKKATANPDFSRYLEYVKEGGMWDFKADTPVIYYK